MRRFRSGGGIGHSPIHCNWPYDRCAGLSYKAKVGTNEHEWPIGRFPCCYYCCESDPQRRFLGRQYVNAAFAKEILLIRIE